jgi:ribosome-associated protein
MDYIGGVTLNQVISDIAIDALEAIKAEDIVTIDVKKQNSLFDQMIIASVDSTRQARAFINHIKDQLKEIGHSIYGVEGESSGEWVLIDLGDLIIHVMQPEIRSYYNLEDLWHETPGSGGHAKQQASST